MLNSWILIRNRQCHRDESRGATRTIGLLALVATLVLVALFAASQADADAAALRPEATQIGSGYADTYRVLPGEGRPGVVETSLNGGNAESAGLPLGEGFGSLEDMAICYAEEVWSAWLTIGSESDSNTTYWGYIPSLEPNVGELDDTEFDFDGVAYTVLNLFFQQTGSVQQLVLEADLPLPGGLVFAAGTDRFAISDSDALGSGGNIHVWRQDSSLGWAEGQTFEVALLLESSFQGFEPPPVVGPEPAALPEGTGIDGTLSPGQEITGEIEAEFQFKSYKLVVEPGEKYRVDMKGAATGDGTLSDPWISGIKGAFDTARGVELQPVWYDELGRIQTESSLPSGDTVQLDQYGRMYIEYTNDNGEIVLRPPMGANDDGGEGFNARLFLVNFPASEYLIAVSGAPNPTATGTFVISLTEVSEDDYSADASNAGTVSTDAPAPGNLEVPGDEEWFAVELQVGVRYVIEVQGRGGPEYLQTPGLVGIYDESGALVDGTQAADDGPQRSLLYFTPASDGIFYIAVAGPSPYMPNRSVIPVGPYEVWFAARS